MALQATFDPSDNKLRVRSDSRLSRELYDRLKAAGFSWAPKQEIFVAPAWTPDREGLLLELCGEIGDEDTSLVERAEERAERFDDYSEKRGHEANVAHAAVERIADNIPLGQPILVGHHSQKHAERDRQKIESGMRRAVKLWETSHYWLDRARGAIHHAKYKELPAVRARRIKTLEADLRKHEKERKEAEQFVVMWQKDGLTLERAKAIANHDHLTVYFTLAKYPRELPISTYEGASSLWSGLNDGIINAEQARDIAIPAHQRAVSRHDRWIAHITNRLIYERAMLGESGGIVADRIKPEKGGACKCWVDRGRWLEIQKVNKVSVTVLDNYGNGGKDFTRTVPFDKLSAIMSKADFDAYKRGERPGVEQADLACAQQQAEKSAAFQAECAAEESSPFEAMKDALKNGVKVVTAPQLFPTPPDIARQVIELAEIEPDVHVLEPSAGTGSLIGAMREIPIIGRLVAVEINPTLAAGLRDRFPNADVRCADFLALSPEEFQGFDRIIANPPFDHGSDIAHVLHAIRFLRAGGRLVSIVANGPRQRAALEPLATAWIDLPPGSFASQGTNVNTAIVVIDK